MEPKDSFIYLLSEIAPKLDARNFTAWMELAMTSSSRRAAVASIMRLASLAGSSTLPSVKSVAESLRAPTVFLAPSTDMQTAVDVAARCL